MKNRSLAAVILLPFVTFGIYSLYWFVSTKKELNQRGASIPTAWLLIIPLVNLYWMWKYFEGAEQVTNKKVNGVLMLVLALFVTSIISSAICQSAYNDLSSGGEVLGSPEPMASTPITAPVEPAAPVAPVTVPASEQAQPETTNQA